MSVGDQLGLDDDNSELLALARERWDSWVESDPRLDVVAEFDDLRRWLRAADPAAADQVLLALAMLSAPDGGDDVAAAAALGKALLPGAATLARRLTVALTGRRHELAVIDQAGDGGIGERVDQMVAAQLWLEIRSFPWRRLTKVAANILMNTRAGVLRELGDHGQLRRVDRTWANTVSSDLLMCGDDSFDDVRTLAWQLTRVRGAAGRWSPWSAEPEPSVFEELLAVLSWATENAVISDDDRYLLLCLVDEASRTDTRRTGRGRGGLTATEVSIKVAPRVGVSEATVRRRAARSMRALAAAVAATGIDP